MEKKIFFYKRTKRELAEMEVFVKIQKLQRVNKDEIKKSENELESETNDQNLQHMYIIHYKIKKLTV